jgi:hypothetical protein
MSKESPLEAVSLRDLYVSECGKSKCKVNTGVLRLLPADAKNNDQLKVIDLSANIVGSQGLHPILVVAQNAIGLESFIAPDNYLSNECVKELTERLDRHPTLNRIDLSRNPISHQGGKLLSAFVRRNEKIEQLVLKDTLINNALVAIMEKKCAENRGEESAVPASAPCTPASANPPEGTESKPSEHRAASAPGTHSGQPSGAAANADATANDTEIAGGESEKEVSSESPKQLSEKLLEGEPENESTVASPNEGSGSPAYYAQTEPPTPNEQNAGRQVATTATASEVAKTDDTALSTTAAVVVVDPPTSSQGSSRPIRSCSALSILAASAERNYPTLSFLFKAAGVATVDPTRRLKTLFALQQLVVEKNEKAEEQKRRGSLPLPGRESPIPSSGNREDTPLSYASEGPSYLGLHMLFTSAGFPLKYQPRHYSPSRTPTPRHSPRPPISPSHVPVDRLRVLRTLLKHSQSGGPGIRTLLKSAFCSPVQLFPHVALLKTFNRPWQRQYGWMNTQAIAVLVASTFAEPIDKVSGGTPKNSLEDSKNSSNSETQGSGSVKKPLWFPHEQAPPPVLPPSARKQYTPLYVLGAALESVSPNQGAPELGEGARGPTGNRYAPLRLLLDLIRNAPIEVLKTASPENTQANEELVRRLSLKALSAPTGVSHSRSTATSATSGSPREMSKTASPASIALEAGPLDSGRPTTVKPIPVHPEPHPAPVPAPAQTHDFSTTGQESSPESQRNQEEIKEVGSVQSSPDPLIMQTQSSSGEASRRESQPQLSSKTSFGSVAPTHTNSASSFARRQSGIEILHQSALMQTVSGSGSAAGSTSGEPRSVIPTLFALDAEMQSQYSSRNSVNQLYRSEFEATGDGSAYLRSPLDPSSGFNLTTPQDRLRVKAPWAALSLVIEAGEDESTSSGQKLESLQSLKAAVIHGRSPATSPLRPSSNG